MAVSADLQKVLDKAWHDKTLEEVLDAPVEALAGVSVGGGKLIRDALGVKTIGELGRNKYFRAAQALAALADAR